MRTLWRRLVAFGFRLLYNEMAWSYDAVSWLVSRGLWRTWQRTALDYLPSAGKVLEVGIGPGHFLVDLVQLGYQPVGLELSPAMLRQARRNTARLDAPVPLYRGRAEALPFVPQAFDAVVLTFPTEYVYNPAWMRHMVRVLRRPEPATGKNGGRLVIVEGMIMDQRTPPWRLLDWLYRITGQRGPAPDLCHLLTEAGLSAWREDVRVEKTIVRLVLADNKPSKSHNED